MIPCIIASSKTGIIEQTLHLSEQDFSFGFFSPLLLMLHSNVLMPFDKHISIHFLTEKEKRSLVSKNEMNHFENGWVRDLN